MINELSKTRNELKYLGMLPDNLYENIFQMYKVDKHFVYNILKKVSMPEGAIEDQYFYYTNVPASTPWTSVSYSEYGTIRLWWIICIVNGIMNPVNNAKPGYPIKMLKPDFVALFIRALKT